MEVNDIILFTIPNKSLIHTQYYKKPLMERLFEYYNVAGGTGLASPLLRGRTCDT